MLTKTKPNRRPELAPCQRCNLRLTPNGNPCGPCRVRKCRGALIDGEACAICGIDMPRVLRWQRFDGGVNKPLCANHAALVGKRSMSWTTFRDEALRVDGALTPTPAAVMLKAG